MRHSATVKWIGLALVGLAIAGGVAIAASRLVSEQIGIASESVSAGEDLAPAVGSAARRAAPAQTGGREPTTESQPSAPAEISEPEPAEPETTQPQPSAPAEATEAEEDDSGKGRGRGRGRGRGGDDSGGDSSGHGSGGSDDD